MVLLLKGNNLNLIIWIHLKKKTKFNDIIFFRNVKVMKNKTLTKNVSDERKLMKHDN